MKAVAVCVMTMVSALCIGGCQFGGNPGAESAAVASATSWLSLIDAEKYAESWDDSSTLFRGAVAKEQWAQMLQISRKPFGKNIARIVKSSRYRTSLPGAPDGEYVVIQFKSSFQNKKAAIETVTPMLDSDGKWRVSGYFMR